MRRLLLVLAACSPGRAQVDEIVPQHVIDPVVRGAHGSSIDIVAVTADGTAAVTQDAEGNTRLWPTLEGKNEPIVAQVKSAEELALVRGLDGFLIASLDATGDLELVRIAPAGMRMSRKSTSDVPVLQIAVVSNFLLALQADERIAVIDGRGNLHGHIDLPAGSRADAIVARGDHAVAIVTRDRNTYATAFDPDTLTWGATSKPIEKTTSRYALSPDGTKLAIAWGTVDVVTLATGAVEFGCGEPRRQEPKDLEAVRRGSTGQVPLAFVDDDTLACFAAPDVRWFRIGKMEATFVHAEDNPELAAYGGTIQVTGEGFDLGISAPRVPMAYLGYELTSPDRLFTGPLGVMLARNAAPVVLDATLHVKNQLSDTSKFIDIEPIDARFLLRTQRREDGVGLEVMFVDESSLWAKSVAITTDDHLHFDPDTNLLAVHNNDRSSLLQYDPVVHTFGKPIAIPGTSDKIYLTDPARADGVVAVSAQVIGGPTNEVDLTEIVLHGGVAEAKDKFLVYGDIVAIDRAGRAYIADDKQLGVFIPGKFEIATTLATLPIAGHPIVVPNRDASRILVLDNGQVTMRDADGSERWTRELGAVDVGWNNGEPFAKFSSSLATLDPKDGRILDRACGWQFGLTASPPVHGGYAKSVCDAE
jgi:hypothetical protein